MLSLTKGRCIGKIVGGEHDGKYIRVYEQGKNYKCCNWCTEKCSKNKTKKCCKDCEVPLKGGCMSCLMSGGRNEKEKDRIEINLRSGTVEPVPNAEKDDDGSYIADTTFVAGPQGVGKSHFISKYIANDKIHYPKKDVIIFSNFEEDKPLDKFKPMRVKIDDKLIEKPIKKEECKNSITVFDDIDTMAPKLAQACRMLRDDFLQCGRKENIKVLATSHQLMNYMKTRDLLNSCNKIVIFPRGTSPYHTTRLLKEYVGLDKNSIKYILKLPSRWIMIDKTYPSYALHENGAVLLNDLPKILSDKKDEPKYEKYGYPQSMLLKAKKSKGRGKNKKKTKIESDSESETNSDDDY